MPPPGRPRRPVTAVLPVRLPLELVDRLDALADALNESRAATMRRIVGWLPAPERDAA